jgi:hypothetical protein
VDPSALDHEAIRDAIRFRHLDVAVSLIWGIRVFDRITTFSIFPRICRVVLLEQFAKRRCRQSNIDHHSESCANFIQRIKQNAILLKAAEAD